MRRLLLTMGVGLALFGTSVVANAQDKGPVQAPVQKPVQAPQQKMAPVQAPTQKMAPVQAPTQKPIQNAVQKPTQKPVQKGCCDSRHRGHRGRRCC